MNRSCIRILAVGLLLGLPFATACNEKATPKPAEVAEAKPGVFVAMDQVDETMNPLITGDRYQIAYTPSDLSKGAPDGALVTIVVYSDYQCSYSARLAESLEQVAAQHPSDVRIVFKQFPMAPHEQAKLAAEAVLAAHAQGKGWAMHEFVFDNPDLLTPADLVRHAEQVGVPDLAKFKADIESGGFTAQVDADIEQTNQFGVSLTPSLFINGVPQSSGASVEQLEQLIAAEKQFAQTLIDAGSKREEVYARILRGAQVQRDPAPQLEIAKPRPRRGRPDPATNYAIPIDDRPVRGNPEALVTIIEYGDFTAPNSRKAQPMLAELEQTYGENLRFVFRAQPGPLEDQAVPSVKVALAAHQQGKFWEMYDALYAKAEVDGLVGDHVYVELAEQIGLDVDKFNADRKSPEVTEWIAEDEKLAFHFVANGSPVFHINGRILAGKRSIEEFRTVIDEEIKKAKAYKRAHKQVAAEDLYTEMIKGWATEVKPSPTADFVRRDISTEGLIGKGNLEDPAITLIMCSDFDCPFCARGVALVDHILESDKYKGKVAFYHAHFPLDVHEQAEPAHRAAVAAANQGKFWEMRDLLFYDSSKRGEGPFMDMAAQLDLDLDRFLVEWNAGATKERVATDRALCSKHGATGTPTFFVNGRMMRGTMPMKMVEPVLDEELAGGFEVTKAATDTATELK